MQTKVKRRISTAYIYLGLSIVLLIIVNTAFGAIMTHYASVGMKKLISTRMLDITNTAADMLDGDVLRRLTPKDKGTPDYEYVMKTLTHFQNNIDLKYIYCIRDKGNKEFVFGLDPTVKDPGEFDSPIVYTEALYQASKGTASVDETSYQDAWGEFYSAYSPVFDSEGKVGGIVAVDFSKEWYDDQLVNMKRTMIAVGLLSLFIGIVLVVLLARRSLRRIRSVNEQFNELVNSFELLMQETKNMSSLNTSEHISPAAGPRNDPEDIDSLKSKIAAIQEELRKHIALVHEQIYIDSTTGVMNKACYINTKNRLETSMADGKTSFSIIVCDMNGLKTINDTFGHEIGDLALKDIAGVLISVFGQKNIFRIGGDEFIVITEEISEESIKEDFERVGESLSSINTDKKPYRVPISISMGYAVYQEESDKSFADVFRRADQMMYSNKSAYYMRRGDRRRKQ